MGSLLGGGSRFHGLDHYPRWGGENMFQPVPPEDEIIRRNPLIES
jgi:hypothetical protein